MKDRECTENVIRFWHRHLEFGVLPKLKGETLDLALAGKVAAELNAVAALHGRPLFELTHSICGRDYFVKSHLTETVALVIKFNTETGEITMSDETVEGVRYV